MSSIFDLKVEDKLDSHPLISVAGDPGGTEIDGDTGATGGSQDMTTPAGRNGVPISNYYLRPDPSGNNVFGSFPPPYPYRKLS